MAPLLPVDCSAYVRLSLSAPLLRVEIARLLPTCFTLSEFILSKKHLNLCLFGCCFFFKSVIENEKHQKCLRTPQQRVPGHPPVLACLLTAWGPGIPWHLPLSFRGFPSVKTDLLTSCLLKFQAREKFVAAQHIRTAFR